MYNDSPILYQKRGAWGTFIFITNEQPYLFPVKLSPLEAMVYSEKTGLLFGEP